MFLTYKRCTFETDEELQQLIDLQNEVYKERGLLFEKEGFIHWFVNNPAGKVMSFCAYDGDKMVSHQSFVPCFVKVGDKVVKSARSMSVVTLPQYQGQGIFSQLTNKAVEYAKAEGYELLYAVTNENSFKGFVKYAGFRFVTRLDVKIGYGWNVQPDGERIFSNYWTKELLQWRLKIGEYFVINNSIIGKFKPMVNTFMGSLPPNIIDGLGNKSKTPFGVHLYVGCGGKLSGLFVKVPKFVKHSPFNFIYRDLTDGKLPPVTKENLFYQLIDFDVA